MHNWVCGAALLTAACSAPAMPLVGGRPAALMVQPQQGVAIDRACTCDVVPPQTKVLDESETDNTDYLCAPSGVSACCIKPTLRGRREFAVDAWYEGKPGVDYDKLDFGNEVPAKSAWILAGQVVIFRPHETDAYCATYASNLLTMQTVFRSRQ